MLTQTASLAKPNAVTNVTAKQAPVQSGAGAVFAALLAKLNPQVGKPDAKTPVALAKAAPQSTTAQDTTDASGDIAAAVAAMQTVAPLPAQALPKTGDAAADAITGGSKPFAALKSVDPAQLRAALTAPTDPAKPGTPTLPVMPAHGDDDAEGEPGAVPPKDFAAKDAPSMPDVAKVVQHLMRPATPSQTTEAQTLPVKFDAKQDGDADTGGSQSNSQQHQHGQPNAQTNSLTGQTSSSPPTQPAVHAPAPQQVEVKTAETPVAPTAVNAAAPVQAAQSTQTTQAVLHITQATHGAAQPDIAALAINIAAKSQGGEKHFDIRLDPPELGHIEVHLSVDDSGKAQAHLAADKQQTLDLLQRDSSTLTKSLKDSGIDLGNAGLSFSLRGQDRDGGAAPRSFAKGRALGVSAVAEATPSNPTIASDSARLDIRV